MLSCPCCLKPPLAAPLLTKECHKLAEGDLHSITNKHGLRKLLITHDLPTEKLLLMGSIPAVIARDQIQDT